jgi:hypothetical protein
MKQTQTSFFFFIKSQITPIKQAQFGHNHTSTPMVQSYTNKPMHNFLGLN